MIKWIKSKFKKRVQVVDLGALFFDWQEEELDAILKEHHEARSEEEMARGIEEWKVLSRRGKSSRHGE